LDFVREGLEGAVLVEGGIGPVFLELNNRLEAEDGGGDFWLEDPDEIGGGCFCEIDDNRLRGNWGVGLLTNAFGKGGMGKTLF
jgi:hypothetical protein